ncbi:MAG TPA: M20 family metallopeptidase [Chitinophagaceae bacterium]|nr:M20 family metallopeptidase [Chitinophagaceae bacterium]
MLVEKIRSLARNYASDFIAVRRHLHAHPELSYQEFETSKFIQEKLRSFGIPFRVMAETGVVGMIRGVNPEKRVVALRADMDALPIREQNDVPYRSVREGLMHACGHDVHTTCLLGAARILNELREDWEGTIKLIFQPGEEKNPGGASLLIRDGVLRDPEPQAIFAMHVHPGLETGKVSFRSGKVMASADELYFTIKGQGGHAASPHAAVDPILIASHLVLALQQVVSRNNNPFNPCVLSITSFQGGTTTNVIPSEVKLMGTFRAMDEEWRHRALELIRARSTSLVESMGGELDIHIDRGYPAVHNDEKLDQLAREKAIEYFGAGNVEETELRMGAEDFGFYAQQIPACFYRVGVRNESKGITAGVHTARFDVDEDAIEVGIGMMALLGSSVTMR